MGVIDEDANLVSLKLIGNTRLNLVILDTRSSVSTLKSVSYSS